MGGEHNRNKEKRPNKGESRGKARKADRWQRKARIIKEGAMRIPRGRLVQEIDRG